MTSREMSHFAARIMNDRYAHNRDGQKETWAEIADRVVESVAGGVPGVRPRDVADLRDAVRDRKFMPGGRYLYASGRPYHQTQNCLLLRAEDTREGWGDLLRDCMLSLMTGAGLGVNYSRLRHEGSPLGRAGGTSSGPLALMYMVNELGRGARQGGARRGAIWAGLSWRHRDALRLVEAKDWPAEIRALKAKDFNAHAPLDMTNVSVCLDDEFFAAHADQSHPEHARAVGVYRAAVRSMLETGEPGFSVDVGQNAGEDLRNACTEVTSADDADICNLGSINLARVDSLNEFARLVELGVLFLLCGTVYSDVPYEKVRRIREKNRRLGLGLMGVHEWLLLRGKTYGPDEELGQWLDAYATSTVTARKYARALGLTPPVKTRAIAPNGTIGIVAETTTSAEPVFCTAYKRRFRDGDVWRYQYVVDPTARRLIEGGVEPASIEDAYDLAADVERRVRFQAWLQGYVDHAISSTINLPPWGTDLNCEHRVIEFGDMLMQYLPRLRGITCYPDGSRDGQPLTRVSYEEAVAGEGETFEEAGDACEVGRAGGCG